MANQSGLRPQHSMKSIPQSSKSKPLDISALQLPIETTVTGLSQAFSVLINGHPDIADLLVNEANIIYECKSCLNLHRCITSFISHKRNFCQKRSFRHSNKSTENGRSPPAGTIAQISDQNIVRLVPEPEDLGLRVVEFNLNDYSPSLDLLKNLDILRQSGVKKSLETVVQSIRSGGKTNEPNNYFRDKIDQLHYKEKANNFTFAEFYDKRLNPRWKTAVLDPTGKVLQPGPLSKEFEQKMINYRDEVNRALTSRPNLYCCQKCERRFTTVNKTIRHLSIAHALSHRTAVACTQWIINHRLPSRRLQAESQDSILQKAFTVKLTRNPVIDRKAIKSFQEERDARRAAEGSSAKLVQDEASVSSPRPNGFTCFNPNLSLLPKPQISHTMSTPIKPPLRYAGEDRLSKTPESSKPLSRDPPNHVSDKILKSSFPNIILEPPQLKPMEPNGCPETSLSAFNTQQPSIQGRSTRRSQGSPTSNSSVKCSSEVSDHALVNGENSEPRKGKRKQANPTLIVQTKSDPKVGPSSTASKRKRANPAHLPLLPEIKRLRVPLG